MSETPKPAKSVPRSDAPTVVLHWGLVATLILSLATGLRIAADAPESRWAQGLEGVLPQGEVIGWHLWSALSLVALVVAYLGFLWRAGLVSRVALDAAWRRNLASPDAARRWRAVNVGVYWLAFAALLLATVSGLLLTLAPGLLPAALLTSLHQWLAWSLIAYIGVHLLALVAVGGLGYLLKILRPRPAYGVAAAVALAAGGAAAAGFYALQSSGQGQLLVTQVTTAPSLDGRGDEALWAEAGRVTIPTRRGANLPGGEVDVTVAAVHDGTHLYALFQWPDRTRSQKHLPLVKTAEGWRVTQTEYGIQDEDSYYEDKFGVMLAQGGGLAGDGSIHLGRQPLDGKPGPSGGRGLHYTTDGSIVDVWHWKSVRSGNPIMNQIDDNYFGPPMEPKKKGRYTGGYTKDPKSAGGFKMNWEAYSDEVVTPLRLPKDPAALERFQSVVLDPESGDALGLFLPLEDTVPYDPALDDYPVGTILPAVLVDGPFEGDRGDVTAVSRWAEGLWTLEVKRKLDTGSEFDVALSAERPTYLWVAVFDHAQTRHSQHLRPVRVSLR